MKWYMGVNTNGIDHYRRMIKAAVISNEKFSNFEPHLVYDGTDHPLIDWLEKRNVTIHPYRVSFHDKIMASSGQKNHFNPLVATGAYLRTEIPTIENDDYILYTDVDVMFTSKVDLSDIRPEIFACAEEIWEGGKEPVFVKSVFNSGVMVMNTQSWRDHLDGFLDFVVKNNFDFPAFDQGALNEYFKDQWNTLPRELNWRPFMGLNDDVKIVHFHGPKPNMIEKFREGGFMKDHVRKLFSLAPEAYEYYLDMFNELEASDE